MEALHAEDLERYDAAMLRSMLVENSQLLAVSAKLCAKLEKEVERLAQALGAEHQQVLFAAESLQRMRHQMFGRKSERREGGGDEAPLFASNGSDEGTTGAATDAAEPKPRRQRERFGRTPQALPVKDVFHTHAEDDVGAHGLRPMDGQYETSELVTVVPSQIVLERHHRQKYTTTDEATGDRAIVTAPGPVKLKDGSRYSLEFGVEVGLAKYQWHLPLDRQRKMMAGHGLDVSTQVLFEQIDTIAWYLAPTVVKGIAGDIEMSRVNIADDTTWMNVGKKDQASKDRFNLWAVTNGRSTCYSVFDARSRKAAKSFLGRLSGVLVSDGADAFKVLASEDLVLANDWFHVRRKFIAAETCYKDEAAFFIERIREMAKIEAEIKGRPPDEVRVARQTLVRPIVDVIRVHLDAMLVLPRSSIGRAIAYTKKLWRGLTVFLDDPDVPMHSNDIERAMRGPAIGRKNHYGSRNMTTAGVAAVWYSIVETCKINGVDPRAYLVETLTAILTKRPYRMPWEWNDDPASLLLN